MVSPCVDILMATYNGEAYLSEQLDSLLNQTYKHWRLTIHDDGSTDRTLAIIRQYVAQDSRITLLDDGVIGLGSAHNFLHLMERVEGEYYLCCDQDDIWLPEKIEKMLKIAQGFDGPAMVYCNAYLYAEGKVLPRFSTQIHPSSLRNTLFFNSGIQGCAVLVNRALLDTLRPFPDKVAMHDHLLTIGAVTFGTIRYLDEGLIWYRQHGLNVTGSQPRGFWSRIKLFFEADKPVVSRTHFDANHAFFIRYGNAMDQVSSRLFQAYFQYGQCRSVLKRLFILLRFGFTLGNKRGILFFKTLIRKPIG